MLVRFPKLKGIYLGGAILPPVKPMDLDLGLNVKIVPGLYHPIFIWEKWKSIFSQKSSMHLYAT